MCQSWVFGLISWLPDRLPHLKGPFQKDKPSRKIPIAWDYEDAKIIWSEQISDSQVLWLGSE